MKLFILTQKVNRNDPILGFFHRWIEEFAKHFESIVVICLEKGEYDLPANVSVYSLGKEEKKSKLQYILRFYQYIWKLRGQYDSVFVHMNQEYVLLGGFLWKLWGKKVFLWRNHAYGNLWTRLAIVLADRVYATSPLSYVKKFTKTMLMPAGIDTEVFSPSSLGERIPGSVLCLGRISPVKKVEIFLASCISLHQKSVPAHALVVGSAMPGDEAYYQRIRKQGASLEEAGVLEFREAVKPQEVPSLYASSEIYVNLTESGSFDKTVLEAMACECLIVISNRSFQTLIPTKYHNLVFFEESNQEDLARKLEKMLAMSQEEKLNIRKELRKCVVENHSLGLLMNKLIHEIE